MKEISQISNTCGNDGFYTITTYKVSENSEITTRVFYCYNQNDCYLHAHGKCPHKV